MKKKWKILQMSIISDRPNGISYLFRHIIIIEISIKQFRVIDNHNIFIERVSQLLVAR